MVWSKLCLFLSCLSLLCATKHLEAVKAAVPNDPKVQLQELAKINENLEQRLAALSQENADLTDRYQTTHQELEKANEDMKDFLAAAEMSPSASICERLGGRWDHTLSPLPLVEWVNASNLQNFYQPTFQSLLQRDSYFTEIDSMGQYELNVQPYGFYSRYELEDDDFKLTTFGASASGGLTLKDCWQLGAGVGYLHSNFNWGDRAHDGSLNTLYFGPYVAYVFNRGYIDLEVLGIYNMYQVDQIVGKNRSFSNDSRRWDVYGSLEGGIDFIGPRFFIQPKFNLSYLAALSNDCEIENEAGEVVITNGFADFFRCKFAAEFRKEFHHQGKGFIIPSVSLGWVLLTPLTNGSTLLFL